MASGYAIPQARPPVLLGIDPQQMDLGRHPPRHRLGQSEGLILMTRLAIANDENV